MREAYNGHPGTVGLRLARTGTTGMSGGAVHDELGFQSKSLIQSLSGQFLNTAVDVITCAKKYWANFGTIQERDSQAPRFPDLHCATLDFALDGSETVMVDGDRFCPTVVQASPCLPTGNYHDQEGTAEPE
jgi:hypothetical protein